jgi:hypothetical protein
MRLSHLERSIRGQFPTKGIAIVAILVLGLLGGLFHHHESESDSAACSYCHSGVQTPVAHLAAALVAPFITAVESVTRTWTAHLPQIVHFSTLIPRAPPVTTDPAVYREGCAGLV